MRNFKVFLLLLSGLLVFKQSASDAINITSLEIDGEFSSCSILKSKYEILKLRLEITEKFGHYVPEIDQKLKALEYKVDKLYQSLEYPQGLSEKQRYAYVSMERGSESLTPAKFEEADVSVPQEIVTEGYVRNVAAPTEKLYITEFDGMEEPKVCKLSANGNSVCYDLVLPTSCADPNGVTCSNNKCRIQAQGSKPFTVACDEDWIVIQRRINGSVDFNRDWFDYKNGFGDLDGEFWLGLDKIHALTTSAPVELLIKMKDFDGYETSAKYDTFVIGNEQSKYDMFILGGYFGDEGDSLSIHLNSQFTTYDRDNDNNGGVNCAQSFFGGWWFYDCDPNQENSNLNGQYYNAELASFVTRENGIKWTTWRGGHYSLKSVQMMIRKK